MTHAVRIHEHGGPDALQWDAVEVGTPGPGEIRIRQSAVGLNYIDVYHRTGLYPVPQLPCVIGMEGAGTVEALGERVTDLAVGDRVAYASPPLGAYAEARLMPADRVVKLPDGIGEQQAAGMMLKGMTAEYLIRRLYTVKPGDTVLFHAISGGVGQIACQWLKALGATVIGTVGSDAKAETARAHGCDHPINYRTEDFVARVREITNGEGVPVVYDGVGKATYMGSLDCLRRRGTLALFGNASGAVDALDTGLLAQKGSLFLTRPSLMGYTATRAELLESANALFDVVGSGQVHVDINQTYPLHAAADAHRDLEARATTGSTVLLPDAA
jgi:NADPH2:quinone reductase